jgi:hypothetical protein
MGSMQVAAAHGFRADLGVVQNAIRARVVSGRARAADKHWVLWETFCHTLKLDGFLTGITDPVPFLQFFGARYRDRRIAPSNHGVRSCTVEEALRSVGQMFARLGAQDIQKTTQGSIDFRIQRQL